jgi:hypothetical protein
MQLNLAFELCCSADRIEIEKVRKGACESLEFAQKAGRTEMRAGSLRGYRNRLAAIPEAASHPSKYKFGAV